MTYRAQNQVGPRAATKKLLQMVDDGLLDENTVLLACLNWMSEFDVQEMCESNEFFDFEEEYD